MLVRHAPGFRPMRPDERTHWPEFVSRLRHLHAEDADTGYRGLASSGPWLVTPVVDTRTGRTVYDLGDSDAQNKDCSEANVHMLEGILDAYELLCHLEAWLLCMWGLALPAIPGTETLIPSTGELARRCAAVRQLMEGVRDELEPPDAE